MTYTMTAEWVPEFDFGTPVYKPCGDVYEAADDADAVAKFWRQLYFGRPLRNRPVRNVRLRDAAGRLILERWT